MRTWHNITLSRNTNRIKRANTNSNVLSFTPEGSHINCFYDIKVTPLVVQPEYVGVGDPSDIIIFEVRCDEFSQITTFQDACSNWCRCSNDPTTFCLLTCDHCYVCDTEPALPSEEDVDLKLSDITSTSLKISVDSLNQEIVSYRLSHREHLKGSPVKNTVLKNRTSAVLIGSLSPHTKYQITIFPQLVIDEETIDSYPLLVNATTLSPPNTNNTVLIACIVSFSVLLLIIAILLIFFYIKKKRLFLKTRQKSNSANDAQANKISYVNTLPNTIRIIGEAKTSQRNSELSVESHEYTYILPQNRKSVNPVDIKYLKIYLTNLTQESVVEEYNCLSAIADGTYHVAEMPENTTKHRFKNNKAYDHSRVILNQVGADITSTYINANYINGCQLEKEYIGCQSPKKNTVIDMWRMIWEQDVNTIVRLTRCTEDGDQKCVNYWPEKEGSRYGQFKVEHLSTSKFSFYVERHFVLSDNEQFRHVTQLQYTNWQEDETPATSCEYLEFHAKVEMLKSKRTGPLVVHCSAGLGKTGTFIALDYLIKQAKTDCFVDVPACVMSLREARAGMVQNLEQYRYVIIHVCARCSNN